MDDIVVVFIVVGLPLLLAFGIVGYRMWLQHRQLQLLLEERRLLIEKGRDLPALQLPEIRHRKPDPLRNLKAGLILLFVAGALFASSFVQAEPLLGEQAHVPVTMILGAVGFALVLLQVIAEAYERRAPRAAPHTEEETVPAQSSGEQDEARC